MADKEFALRPLEATRRGAYVDPRIGLFVAIVATARHVTRHDPKAPFVHWRDAARATGSEAHTEHADEWHAWLLGQNIWFWHEGLAAIRRAVFGYPHVILCPRKQRQDLIRKLVREYFRETRIPAVDLYLWAVQLAQRRIPATGGLLADAERLQATANHVTDSFVQLRKKLSSSEGRLKDMKVECAEACHAMWAARMEAYEAWLKYLYGEGGPWQHFNRDELKAQSISNVLVQHEQQFFTWASYCADLCNEEDHQPTELCLSHAPRPWCGRCIDHRAAAYLKQPAQGQLCATCVDHQYVPEPAPAGGPDMTHLCLHLASPHLVFACGTCQARGHWHPKDVTARGGWRKVTCRECGNMARPVRCQWCQLRFFLAAGRGPRHAGCDCVDCRWAGRLWFAPYPYPAAMFPTYAPGTEFADLYFE